MESLSDQIHNFMWDEITHQIRLRDKCREKIHIHLLTLYWFRYTIFDVFHDRFANRLISHDVFASKSSVFWVI